MKGELLVTEISIVRLEPKREEFPAGIEGVLAFWETTYKWRDMRSALGVKLFAEQFARSLRGGK